VIDAEKDFLADLEGVADPQEKRRRIGHRFIDVFKSTAHSLSLEGEGRGEGESGKKLGPIRYLAQGTLYPDVIESGQSLAGTAANIKPGRHRGEHQAAPQCRGPARRARVRSDRAAA